MKSRLTIQLLRLLQKGRTVVSGTPLASIPGIKRIYSAISKRSVPKENFWHQRYGYYVYLDGNQPGAVRNIVGSGPYEEQVENVIRKSVSRGDTVLDIGGHLGVYTLLFRSIVEEEGSVIVVEPHPRSAKFIKKTIERNGFDNVYLIKSAAADEWGKVNLQSNESKTSASTVLSNPSKDHGYDTVHSVDTIILDDWLSKNDVPNPSFVKMDVQGSELEACIGLEDTLQSATLLLEVHGQYMRSDKTDSLYQFLSNLGSVKDLEENEQDPEDWYDKQQHVLFRPNK